jgi:uncharacterized membrane protein YdjX (TVP38/TMEM64 family)
MAYWAAARWLRKIVERWLSARGHRIPSLTTGEEMKVILLCRLTPGLPLTLQNYILGCARVRFSRYLLGSLPIQWACAVAFVVFGDSITHSSVWAWTTGACLLVAMALLIKLVRTRVNKRARPRESFEVSEPAGAPVGGSCETKAPLENGQP